MILKGRAMIKKYGKRTIFLFACMAAYLLYLKFGKQTIQKKITKIYKEETLSYVR